MIIPSHDCLKQRKKFQKRIAKGESPLSIMDSVTSLDELRSLLASAILFKMGLDDRVLVMERMKERFANPGIHRVVKFLEYGFNLAEEHLAEAKRHAEGLGAEDLLFYVENAIGRIDNASIAPDGNKYPDKILASMRGHIVGNIGGLLDFIQRQEILFTGNTTQRNRQRAVLAFKSISNLQSIYYSLVEVLHGHYVPIEISENDRRELFKISPTGSGKKFIYYLARNPPVWSEIEAYRDLNYIFMDHEFEDKERVMGASIASGFHQYDSSNGFLRVDFARGSDFEIELSFQTVTNILSDIYGNTGILFSYNGNKYEIDQLILVAKKIAKLRVAAFSRNDWRQKKYDEHLMAVGYRRLMKSLDITSGLEPLIELFVFDCDSGDRPTNAQFLPLFKSHQVYYLMPSLMDSMCYEKVIDKILSRSDVKIDALGKGYAFEDTILDLLKASGYKCGKVERDESSDVPEIDGIISLDENTIVIYEAKCSVKPETRYDAIGFIENHLEKAVRQLLERVSFVRDRPEEIASRIGLRVKDKLIIPLVIANHSYFTGLNQYIDDQPIFIIDIELFKDLFVKRKAPAWEYSAATSRYLRRTISIQNASEIAPIISDLTKLLRSFAPPTVVVNDYGIGYEIHSPPQIDFLASRSADQLEESRFE